MKLNVTNSIHAKLKREVHAIKRRGYPIRGSTANLWVEKLYLQVIQEEVSLLNQEKSESSDKRQEKFKVIKEIF